MKKVELWVHVQLSDGTTKYLPIVSNEKIKRFDSRKDAYDWAEFVLHEKVRIKEVEINDTKHSDSENSEEVKL